MLNRLLTGILLLALCGGCNELDDLTLDPASTPSPTPTPTPTPPPTEGLSAQAVQALWTAYHPQPIEEGSGGSTLRIKLRNGKTRTISISAKEARQARMESVIKLTDGESGSPIYAYHTTNGPWKQVPKGAKGVGNRSNPLVPYRHVAADNRQFRYGSLVYLAEADGVSLGDGPIMDGYFWIADAGGAVKGAHFDLFVGSPDAYRMFKESTLTGRHETKIWRLPDARSGFDPRQPGELAALLVEAGYLHEDHREDPLAVRLALRHWQQENTYIPKAEYGDPTGAITLWFLVQLGHALPESKSADS